MEEWKSWEVGRAEEWKGGRMEDWKNGGLEERKIGRMGRLRADGDAGHRNAEPTRRDGWAWGCRA